MHNMTRTGSPTPVKYILKKGFQDTPKNSMKIIEESAIKKVFEYRRLNMYLERGYQVDQFNKEPLECLIYLFSQNPKMLLYGDRPEHPNPKPVILNAPSLMKGAYLFGEPGTGKTDAFKIFDFVAYYSAQNWGYNKLKYKTMSAAYFVSDYKQAERNNMQGELWDKYLYGKTYVDDLGLEEKFYGDELIARFILAKYDVWKNNPDNMLFVSSNLNLSELCNRYGQHLADRIVEMCNIIKIQGPEGGRRR